MSGPTPCHCPAPNEDCRRAGRPMLGRLWELCAGVNCAAEQSERYRRFWDGQPQPAPCVHLGMATGAAVECHSCAGTVRVKLFTCAAHGDCTQAKPIEGHACCRGCTDYRGAPGGNLT